MDFRLTTLFLLIISVMLVIAIADQKEEEEEEYDCFWGEDQEHRGGGEWNVTANCPKGDFRIGKASNDDPLSITMKWRNGTDDFMFCALPSNSFHQPWTVIANIQTDAEKIVTINQEMKYYTYETPENLVEMFSATNCAISVDQELQVTITPDDKYWSLRFKYIIYPLQIPLPVSPKYRLLIKVLLEYLESSE